MPINKSENYHVQDGIYTFPVTVDDKGTQVLMQAQLDSWHEGSDALDIEVARNAEVFRKRKFPNALEAQDLEARGLTVNGVLNAVFAGLKEKGFDYRYSTPLVQNHIRYTEESWGGGLPRKLIDTLTSDEFNKRLPELLETRLAFESAKTELLRVMPRTEAEIMAALNKPDYQRGIALQELLVKAYQKGMEAKQAAPVMRG